MGDLPKTARHFLSILEAFAGGMAVAAGVSWVLAEKLKREMRPTTEAFDAGYAKGFREGRETVRPTVVPMSRPAENS